MSILIEFNPDENIYYKFFILFLYYFEINTWSIIRTITLKKNKI
jgi:hypothetical protein